MTDNYGADAATEVQTLDGTWTLDDEEFDLRCEDLRKTDIETLQELQQVTARVAEGEAVDEDAVPSFSFEAEGDADRDWLAVLIDHKLVKPDINPDEASLQALRALVEGMTECWGVGDDIQRARDEMPTPGNR